MARTLWEEGTRPGRQVVVLGSWVTVALALIDIALGDGVGAPFDIAFVLLCVTLALLVRPQDFFTVCLLPPLLMLGCFALLGLIAPGTIAEPDHGLIQATLTGLASHPTALALGYALALGCLEIRRRVLQASKRSGSPAPRRITSGTPSE